jgi:DNA-binding cell septation regulator SpoVG
MTAPNAAPPARRIVISDWRPRERNTLRGFFTVTLPSGMVVHDAMLHERGEVRWIGLPAREYTDPAGKRQFARIIEFVNREVQDKFQATVLEALDEYLRGLV